MTEYEQTVIDKLDEILTNQTALNDSLTEISGLLTSIKTYDAYICVLGVTALVIFVAYAMVIYLTDLDHRL